MVDHEVECLWSLISFFLVQLFNVVRKALGNLLVAHRRSHSSDASGTILVPSKGCNLEERIGDVKMAVDHDDQVEAVRKMMRKRPAMIVIPESSCCVGSGFWKEEEEEVEVKEVEVEGSGYCLASRRGKRHVMEDGYGVITDINGDSKQAYFGVFDGHGGRAAVDFVSEKLGKNIIRAFDGVEGGDDKLEVAIRSGYLTTDTEFLTQGLNSGVCAATVLLKGGELHVGNVGDCRVVMSRNGEADILTSDHCPGREDERTRIESSGGYVSCRNGIWRVQDSLAVSRAIGDANLKEWIISEPGTRSLQLTPDCEFLILASDGLWHKVTDQEAVDVVARNGNLMKSCKDLVEISCRRGSRDDITVMVVDLRRFVQFGGCIS